MKIIKCSFLLFCVGLFLVLSACNGDFSYSSQLSTITPTTIMTLPPIVTPFVVPEVPPASISAWNNKRITTLCLVKEVNGDLQNYITKHPDKSPFIMVQAMMKGMGIEIVSIGQSCDATLMIKLDGISYFETYSGYGNIYLGGKVTGEITLSSPNLPDLTKPIENIKPLPQDPIVILNNDESGLIKTPEDYPFIELYTKPILLAFNDFWGFQALFYAKPYSSEGDTCCGGEVSTLLEKYVDEPSLLPFLYIQARSKQKELSEYALNLMGSSNIKNNPKVLDYLTDLLHQDYDSWEIPFATAGAIGYQLDINEQKAAKILIDCVQVYITDGCGRVLDIHYNLSYGNDADAWNNWFMEKFPQ